MYITQMKSKNYVEVTKMFAHVQVFVKSPPSSTYCVNSVALYIQRTLIKALYGSLQVQVIFLFRVQSVPLIQLKRPRLHESDI